MAATMSLLRINMVRVFRRKYDKLKLKPKLSIKNLLLFSLIFAAIASVILFAARAATPTASIEPEGGNISGCAFSEASNSSASGGAAVKFGCGIGSAPQPTADVRAMFYYPWFPEAWDQQGFNPFSNFMPTAGLYSSTDTATVNRHIDTMIYAGMNSAIYSWWGQGTKEDLRFRGYLDVTGNKPLKWAAYYEMEGQGNPSVAQIQSDLNYIKTNYANHGNYLRISTLPVVLVWADDADNCEMATRWKQASAGLNMFVVLKVFPNYYSCTDQPLDWYQYGFNMTTGEDSQGNYSFTIGPGYWKKGCPYGGGLCSQGDNQPFLARDLSRWEQNVRNYKASAPFLKLVTSFNEWGEGSAVESAAGTMPNGWDSASGYGAYIDILHQVLVVEP